MLHEFIKACRQHHATLCISHKCLPQASPKLNVEEGRRDQLHDSISNCSTNKMKDMKRRQSCNEEKTKFTNSEAAQEPRPFPLGIFNLETQAGVTGMQDLSSVERNNARANLPLLELNVLQQRISSTECFHQQLRNTFNALQIKMEANLRVLEARINALERAHPISNKKWPQIKESLWLDRRQNLARCRVSNMTFNPLFQVADVSAFNNLHEKEDLADQIIRTHSNKVATNLEATLEQAKNTLSDLEYYLAC